MYLVALEIDYEYWLDIWLSNRPHTALLEYTKLFQSLSSHEHVPTARTISEPVSSSYEMSIRGAALYEARMVVAVRYSLDVKQSCRRQ
jgi:hypothetical protein